MELGLRPRFADALKTVVAGFLGVRRRDAHDSESGRIRPGQVIVAGVIAAALFVLTLVGVVHLVTR